jgi:hypothetical protein
MWMHRPATSLLCAGLPPLAVGQKVVNRKGGVVDDVVVNGGVKAGAYPAVRGSSA